jgi:hypothetical protein
MTVFPCFSAIPSGRAFSDDFPINIAQQNFFSTAEITKELLDGEKYQKNTSVPSAAS